MRVAVTGASGFLGGHVCESLLERGHEPVALIRSTSDDSLLSSLGVEIRHADLADGPSLREGMRGVDAVMHLAAYYTFFGSWDLYERVNVTGTRLLIEAMFDAGVDRIIHCSTTEVIGPVNEPPADEKAEPNPTYDYGRSKLMAEEVVRSYGKRGASYTILRPSGIYGPRNVDDISYWTITSYANNALGTRFHVGSARNLIQFVHVHDVVQAFMLALEHPEASRGKTYNVSDSRAYSYEEVYDILSELTGRPPPSLHVSRYLARLMVSPVEVAMRLMGKDSFLYRRSTIDSVTTDRAYSIERISRELGYEPRYDLRSGLEDTVAWYREHGHIR